MKIYSSIVLAPLCYYRCSSGKALKTMVLSRRTVLSSRKKTTGPPGPFTSPRESQSRRRRHSLEREANNRLLEGRPVSPLSGREPLARRAFPETRKTERRPKEPRQRLRAALPSGKPSKESPAPRRDRSSFFPSSLLPPGKGGGFQANRAPEGEPWAGPGAGEGQEWPLRWDHGARHSLTHPPARPPSLAAGEAPRPRGGPRRRQEGATLPLPYLPRRRAPSRSPRLHRAAMTGLSREGGKEGKPPWKKLESKEKNTTPPEINEAR